MIKGSNAPTEAATGLSSNVSENLFPPICSETLEEWGTIPNDDPESTEVWYLHQDGIWMHEPLSQVYFHIPTQLLYIIQMNEKQEMNLVPIEAPAIITSEMETQGSEVVSYPNVPSSPNYTSQKKTTQYHTSSEESYDEEEVEDEFEMDLAKELIPAVFVQQGTAQMKPCEDRYILKQLLPMDILANTDAIAYLSAVMDGHGGEKCSDYLEAHLANNIMGAYRQYFPRILKKRSLKQYKHSKFEHTVEVQCFIESCKKAFELTDKNYLNFSMQKGIFDGSTACVVIFYGPDDNGSLKLITCNLGDSRAILCRNKEAIRLTEDHKPNNPKERSRIEESGGSVVKCDGIYRAVGLSDNLKRTIGLSTSRAFGNIELKTPKEIISAEPTIDVFSVDFERDLFLVICSDGVFDVLNDQIVINTILQYLDEEGPDVAAKAVVKKAIKEGSTDDITCLIMLFNWKRLGIYDSSSSDSEREKVEKFNKVGDLESEGEDIYVDKHSEKFKTSEESKKVLKSEPQSTTHLPESLNQTFEAQPAVIIENNQKGENDQSNISSTKKKLESGMAAKVANEGLTDCTSSDQPQTPHFVAIPNSNLNKSGNSSLPCAIPVSNLSPEIVMHVPTLITRPITATGSVIVNSNLASDMTLIKSNEATDPQVINNQCNANRVTTGADVNVNTAAGAGAKVTADGGAEVKVATGADTSAGVHFTGGTPTSHVSVTPPPHSAINLNTAPNSTIATNPNSSSIPANSNSNSGQKSNLNSAVENVTPNTSETETSNPSAKLNHSTNPSITMPPVNHSDSSDTKSHKKSSKSSEKKKISSHSTRHRKLNEVVECDLVHSLNEKLKIAPSSDDLLF